MHFYHSLVKEKVSREGDKSLIYDVKITHLERIECTTDDLVNTFNEMIQKFCMHKFITSRQYKALKERQKEIELNSAYIVVDFSQNYNGKYHKSIHSADFGASKTQISFHCGVIYYINSDGKMKCLSLVVNE